MGDVWLHFNTVFIRFACYHPDISVVDVEALFQPPSSQVPSHSIVVASESDFLLILFCCVRGGKCVACLMEGWGAGFDASRSQCSLQHLGVRGGVFPAP